MHPPESASQANYGLCPNGDQQRFLCPCRSPALRSPPSGSPEDAPTPSNRNSVAHSRRASGHLSAEWVGVMGSGAVPCGPPSRELQMAQFDSLAGYKAFFHGLTSATSTQDARGFVFRALPASRGQEGREGVDGVSLFSVAQREGKRTHGLAFGRETAGHGPCSAEPAYLRGQYDQADRGRLVLDVPGRSIDGGTTERGQTGFRCSLETPGRQSSQVRGE